MIIGNEEKLKYAPTGSKAAIVFFGIAFLLCAYLVRPALNAVHLEGFTAQTESLAIMKSRSPAIEHDPYLPLVSQFIYQTRSAVIDTLSLIYTFIPSAGDFAFHALVLASFVLLIISSTVFASRWGGIPPALGVFALVLTQGIPETAFFFNDNIISAALAITSIAFISKEPKKTRWFAAGVLMGVAILSRVDAVFMLPILLGVIFYSNHKFRIRILASSILCITIFLVLSASAIYHGFSLADAFVTASKFVLAEGSFRNWISIRALFFGVIVFPALIVGGWIHFHSLKKERAYIGILSFIFYPILLMLLAPKATEIRYIFPLLSPIIALHAGRGLLWVYQALPSGFGSQTILARAIAIFSLFALFSPPTLVQVFDGPRTLLGRFWSPYLWATWQDSVDTSMTRARQLTNLLEDNRRNVLITTHYNDEFFLRLRLIESGFTPLLATDQYPECNGFSLFKKGNSTVIHIRTEPQYNIAPISITQSAALQLATTFACTSIVPFDNVFISTFGINDYGVKFNIYGFLPTSFPEPLEINFPDSLSGLLPRVIRSYGLFSYRKIEPGELLAIQSNATNYLARDNEKQSSGIKPFTIQDYNKAYRSTDGPTSKQFNAIRQHLLEN